MSAVKNLLPPNVSEDRSKSSMAATASSGRRKPMLTMVVGVDNIVVV
jgi:hypothetical protein